MSYTLISNLIYKASYYLIKFINSYTFSFSIILYTIVVPREVTAPPNNNPNPKILKGVKINIVPNIEAPFPVVLDILQLNTTF